MALKTKVGLSDDEIAGLTKDEAVERLDAYWARERGALGEDSSS